ncbi:MAG TPA: hypothetical protein VFT58_06150, partial [Nitrososphaera sp.]|nr:hypothetical protein [Nitrososphaera sp.]
KYGKDITASFNSLVKRYPKDVTAESLFHDCLSGAKELWLILDDDQFMAMAMTRLGETAAGTKLLTIADLAGKGWSKWFNALADTLEAYAEENGAIPQWEGRYGWGKAVAEKRGYRPVAVLYRKVA